MTDGRPHGRKSVVIVAVLFGGVFAVVAAGAVAIYLAKVAVGDPPPEEDLGDLAKIDDPPVALVRASTAVGYVGSEACAECHRELYDMYQTHPMSQSMAAAGEEAPVEDWEQEVAFTASEHRRYEIEKTEEQQIHREVLFDEQGPILEQAEEVGYIVGSGRRGRSFLVNHEGILFQSPITWYSQEGKWDLSPGYHPQHHPSFKRRIGDGCLYCHAGVLSTTEPGSDRYDEKPLMEAAIGCERCHGPGRDHIELHRSGGESQFESIINPSKLEGIARDSVCYQCHLQGEAMVPRRGKTHLDFRPGDEIEDVWVAFVASTRGQGDETRAVSQVQQMRSSACFLGSEGRMGCVSCHDPHFQPPAAERTAFYNNRCAECHVEQGCSLPEPQRLALPAQGSCIDCHMPKAAAHDVPHTAHTDHRIRRRPQAAEAPVEKAGVDDYQVFDNADERLPAWELDRAYAIASLARPDAARNMAQLQRAESLLLKYARAVGPDRPVLETLRSDVPALVSLAQCKAMQQQSREARQTWTEVLQADPRNELALAALIEIHHGEGDTETTEKLLQRLMQVNPYEPTLHGRRAHLLGQQGDMFGAIGAAELGLRLDPTMLQLQEWLVAAYELTEQPEKSKEQQALVDRLQQIRRETEQRRP